jgi:hypothetical protein
MQNEDMMILGRFLVEVMARSEGSQVFLRQIKTTSRTRQGRWRATIRWRGKPVTTNGQTPTETLERMIQRVRVLENM